MASRSNSRSGSSSPACVPSSFVLSDVCPTFVVPVRPESFVEKRVVAARSAWSAVPGAGDAATSAASALGWACPPPEGGIEPATAERARSAASPPRERGESTAVWRPDEPTMCARSAAQRSLAAACATCIFRVSSFAASSSARASFTARALAALHCASRDSMASLTRASNLSASRRSSSRDSRSASAAARASARDAFRCTIRSSSCAFCSCSCVIFAFCALDMARCIRSMPPIVSSLFRASDLALSSSASREMDLDRAAASSTEDRFAAIALASASSASS
mmetsp:Transcript_13019/g.56629  ORF Transcript_13019/g.56629 Transcript_13019/m.56629 type:complete len:280 (-) Transcript_13019:218-1057(-)